MSVVLDSWAILRYLEDSDPAASAVAGLLDSETPTVSWINLGEVFYILRRRAGETQALAAVRDLRHVLEAELPTSERVLEAARIKAEHRMAYADAFAAATAAGHGATLWTGDPELLIRDAPWSWHDLRPQP
ncbi:MAG: PIN domain-containing protein [Acidimicrobiaceae bacterium]|nr:PIN domain-containing protein [Acidimicrobiaceae bacterium]